MDLLAPDLNLRRGARANAGEPGVTRLLDQSRSSKSERRRTRRGQSVVASNQPFSTARRTAVSTTSSSSSSRRAMSCTGTHFHDADSTTLHPLPYKNNAVPTLIVAVREKRWGQGSHRLVTHRTPPAGVGSVKGGCGSLHGNAGDPDATPHAVRQSACPKPARTFSPGGLVWPQHTARSSAEVTRQAQLTRQALCPRALPSAAVRALRG